MPVTIQDRLISLETEHSLYQMMIDPYGQLLHLWYGERTDQNMDYLLDPTEINFSGNIYESQHDRSYSNDTIPLELPASGFGDYRISALSIRLPSGAESLNLKVKKLEPSIGKKPIPGLPYSHDDSSAPVDTLDIVLEDSQAQIEAVLHYGVFYEEDIISRSIEIRNLSDQKITIRNIAPVSIDFLEGRFDLIHFYGRHNQERIFERKELMHGIQTISSSRGNSSHQHNPAMILASPDAEESHGNVWGALLMYSGSFEGSVEKDQIDHVRWLLGMNPDQFEWHLEAGGTFHSPEGLMGYSSEGFSSLSHSFHQMIERHVLRGRFASGPKPVLLNSWEAAYFTFDGLAILNLARETKELGADLLVLDDGWFGHRDNDYTSLGDWNVNEDKLQMSLSTLVDQVHQMGLKFGLWIEPEMISEESELFKKHPEWTISIPGRNPIVARGQLVIDMANPEVIDYLYETFSRIIRDNRIDYIKWDFNRSVTNWHSGTLSPEQQAEMPHRFMLGTYDLLDRLTKEFPDVLFEGCAGGGGRFDAGMLYYTPQIWCSDDTDAHERTKIQYGTSFFYPIRTVGSHVSAIPNHQTGRMTALESRATVAMPGTFGYELDPAELDRSEKRRIQDQIVHYKKMQPLIFDGHYYRLSNPQKDGLAAWSFVSENREEVLVQGLIYRYHTNMPLRRIRLQGLNPEGLYQVESCTYDLKAHGRFDDGKTPAAFSGRALMSGGLMVQTDMKDDAAFEILLREVKNQTAENESE